MKKGISKNCVRYFEIRKYTFLIFEKAYEQKMVLGILGLVSMLFNIIIFSMNEDYRDI